MSTHTPLLNIGPYLYQPKHQIDETKMSTLWVAMEQRQLARQNGSDDQVVLKIARMSDTKYSLTNQRAIENEEKWLSLLRHPNIVHLRPIAELQQSRQQIYRARSELPGNPWFLVTDFLPGGDLSSVLSERRKLPASLALEITERVADALAYLHAHNCVHCDIKPRNILFRRKPEGYALTPETQPIVIDFGIAKNPVEGRQLVSGTPRWITPEMAQAMSVGTKLDVDPSWDIYALGLVLYNAITGNKPKLDLPGSQSWERIKPADLSSDPSVANAKSLADGLNRLITGATADDHRQRLSADAFLGPGTPAAQLRTPARGSRATASGSPRHVDRCGRGPRSAWAGGADLVPRACAFYADHCRPRAGRAYCDTAPTNCWGRPSPPRGRRSGRRSPRCGSTCHADGGAGAADKCPRSGCRPNRYAGTNGCCPPANVDRSTADRNAAADFDAAAAGNGHGDKDADSIYPNASRRATYSGTGDAAGWGGAVT